MRTLCLCGDRCATGYHKDTKAQRKFVSDISMQSNPHNSAKSHIFVDLPFSVVAGKVLPARSILRNVHLFKHKKH